MVKNQFNNIEFVKKMLDNQNITLRENEIIKKASKRCAELLCDNFSDESLNNLVDIFIGGTDIRNYVYDETLEILKNEYKIDISNIKIQEDKY